MVFEVAEVCQCRCHMVGVENLRLFCGTGRMGSGRGPWCPAFQLKESWGRLSWGWRTQGLGWASPQHCFQLRTALALMHSAGTLLLLCIFLSGFQPHDKNPPPLEKQNGGGATPTTVIN
jgi:hypothetical protein